MLLKTKIFLRKIHSRIYSLLNPLGYNTEFYSKNSLSSIPKSLKFLRDKANVLILIEPRNFHQYYIFACEELSIEYVLLDLRDHDWFEKIILSGCNGILGWPSAVSPLWKELYDERMMVIQNYLNVSVMPNFEETWPWESKRRMAYYFKTNNIQTPQTNIFYSYKQALKFIDKTNYPLVYKSDHGDSSQGVKILKTKTQAKSLVKKAFGNGLRYGLHNALESERGFIIFQQYLNFEEEWRIIRLDNYYFGYKKNKIGYFASGNGIAVFKEVPKKLLNLVKEITTKNNFSSMSFDIIIHKSTPYFIEAQSLFGPTKQGHKSELDGVKGAYIFSVEQNLWNFVEGDFDRNNGCNIRVEKLLEQLKEID